MELLYFYFEELNGVKDIGVSLTNRYKFNLTMTERKVKLNITDNENCNEDFFCENKKIDIYGIIGENGVGKTSILNAIKEIFEPNNSKGFDGSFFYVSKFKGDQKFYYEDRFSTPEKHQIITYNLCEENVEHLPIIPSNNIFLYNKNEILSPLVDNFNLETHECSIYYDNFNKYFMMSFMKDEYNELDTEWIIEEIFDKYRHINEDMVTSFLILNLYYNKKDVYNYYISECSNVGLIPYSKGEYAQWNYKGNTDILDTITNIGKIDLNSFNDREYIYILCEYIYNSLIKINNNKNELDLDLITQFIIDYIILYNTERVNNGNQVCEMVNIFKEIFNESNSTSTETAIKQSNANYSLKAP